MEIEFPNPPEGSEFKIKDVMNINFKPHPYTIGPKHVVYAADHNGGILSENAIEEAEKKGVHCAVRGCRVPYTKHTSDRVAVVEITGNYDTPNLVPGLHEYLKSIADLAQQNKVDGFVFRKGGK